MRRPTFSPKPEAELSRFADPVIEFGGFSPKTELAGADIACNAFSGRADARQLIIVNGSSAVHCDMCDDALLEQIDDMPVNARAQNVGAHHEDTRRSRYSWRPPRRSATVAKSGCR